MIKHYQIIFKTFNNLFLDNILARLLQLYRLVPVVLRLSGVRGHPGHGLLQVRRQARVQVSARGSINAFV